MKNISNLNWQWMTYYGIMITNVLEDSPSPSPSSKKISHSCFMVLLQLQKSVTVSFLKLHAATFMRFSLNSAEISSFLFSVQPPRWGAWSAHCTWRKSKKKVHRHNHKSSSEDLQINTVADNLPWRKTSSHHRAQTLKCDFVSVLVIVCIYSSQAQLVESQYCIKLVHNVKLLFDASDFNHNH